MTDEGASRFVIRPYRAGDRQAVRDICAACCWMGEHRPELAPDDWIWSEYWTRYFTDVEPQYSWVVQDAAGRVAGYLNGTADERRFHAYAPRLMPGIVWHVIRRRLIRKPQPRRAIFALVRAMFRDEMEMPPSLMQRYPATWHFNLLPAARGGGMGRKLLATFLDHMKAVGVSGAHAQPLSINRAVAGMLGKTGFSLATTRPTRAFEHVQPQHIDVQTWVRLL